MSAKLCSHLLRLCLVLHALTISYSLIIKLEKSDRFHLNTNIEPLVNEYVKTNNYLVISLSVMESATNLVSYFNKHKMALAGYDLNDWTDNYYDLLIKYKAEIKSKMPSILDEVDVSDDIKKLSKHILLMNGEELTSNEINQKKRGLTAVNASTIKSAFNYLDKIGLGKLIETKNKSNNKVIFLIVLLTLLLI